MICCRASELYLQCFLCLETLSRGFCIKNFPDIQLTNHTSSSINLNWFCQAIEANYSMIKYCAELQMIKFPSAVFWIWQGSIGMPVKSFSLILQVVTLQFVLRLFSEEGDDQCCQSVSLNVYYQMKISLKINLDSLQSGLIFITVDVWSCSVPQSQKEQLALCRLLKERSSVLGASTWDI